MTIGSLDIFPGNSSANINSLSGYPLTVSHGGTGSTFLAPGGVLIGNGSSSILSQQLTTGQLLFGNGSAGTIPVAGSVVGSGGIGVTYNSMTATLTISGGSSTTFAWSSATGSTAAMPNMGYYCIGSLTLTLPTTVAAGDVIRIAGGVGSTGWTIQANGGQTIMLGSMTTSSGGTLTSTNGNNAAELLCVQADTVFSVISSMGNITVA
jgi:hypothetical protein